MVETQGDKVQCKDDVADLYPSIRDAVHIEASESLV